MEQQFYVKQWDVQLRPRTRGFHLITDEVLSATDGFDGMQVGICQVFIQHTSASLTLNENTDPDVRTDLETTFSELIPDANPAYVHQYEGPDDMPAHAKSTVIGSSVSFPIRDGRPVLGTWQGLYLCEHRNRGGARRLCITAMGSAGAV